MNESPPISLSETDCESLCARYFGIEGTANRLPGYEDLNFRITATDGRRFVMKFVSGGQHEPLLAMQNRVLSHLSARGGDSTPAVIPDEKGQLLVTHEAAGQDPMLIRLLTFVPGKMYADAGAGSAEIEKNLGEFLGHLDKSLSDFDDPAAYRYQEWDLQYAPDLVAARSHLIADDEHRARVDLVLRRFQTDVAPTAGRLRKGVIHNDANEFNVIASDDVPAKITGIIDFGDIAHTWIIGEVAIACAYAIPFGDDPLETMANVLEGYHRVFPVEPREIKALYHLVGLRMATSMVNAAHYSRLDPDNEYIVASQAGIRRALGQLMNIDPVCAELALQKRCGFVGASADALRESRRRLFSHNLSLSYREPLKIMRGWGAYLYDEDGGRHLDMVNNVCHVGHCHPHVVSAGQDQMAELNTNTRYLHDGIVSYAERILAMFPDPLSVVMFVNSGSEANELALRLAATHTGREDVVVVDGAYHGSTQACIDVSPYKFNGPGGKGRKPRVHIVDTPDPYRGRHRGMSEETGRRYADDAAKLIASVPEPAAFICESIQSVGGQVVMPPGYLHGVYEAIRTAGGVCIADEVQTGFGRVGSAWWGFESQGAVPDIVTLGKPMGNGHPLAACATTREIADSFSNGMEFFNTFGGNPVSCAIGSAVLDVLEEEQLRDNARDVGAHLIERLRDLQQRFPIIGDVRGLGLFIGIELVNDRETLAPAADQATQVVERARQNNILLSTDGPLHNVIKIKPPIVFSEGDADQFLAVLEAVLDEPESQPSKG